MTRGLIDELPSTRPLASFLPAMLQADDFCVRFTQGLDPVLAPVLSTIDNLDAYVDPWLTPPDFLDWLAGWFGLELDATWPEERRRALVANALELGRWRGTVVGLAMLVELYTGDARRDRRRRRRSSRRTTRTSRCPGERRTAVTVRYTPGDGVDAARLAAARPRRRAGPPRRAVRGRASMTIERRAHVAPRTTRREHGGGAAMQEDGDAMTRARPRATRAPTPARSSAGPTHDTAWQGARRAAAAGHVRRRRAAVRCCACSGWPATPASARSSTARPRSRRVAGARRRRQGRRLAAAGDVRADMEQSLGADFGDVRVHDGGAAAASAAGRPGQGVHGRQRGRVQPRRLPARHRRRPAHAGPRADPRRAAAVRPGRRHADGRRRPVSHPDDRFEREAEATATSLGHASRATPASPPAAVQRQEAASPDEDDEPADAPMPLQRGGRGGGDGGAGDAVQRQEAA